MPQRIVVLTTYICSVCQAESDNEPSFVTTYQISGPGKPLNLDVCKLCHEVGPFQLVLQAGLPASKGTTTPPKVATKGGAMADTQCPECGDYFSHAGLSLHRHNKHGVVPDSVLADARRREGHLACPECDHRSTSPQGLGAHRRLRHGIAGSGKGPRRLKADRGTGPIKCDECDWGGNSPQGLGVHKRYAHPVES